MPGGKRKGKRREFSETRANLFELSLKVSGHNNERFIKSNPFARVQVNATRTLMDGESDSQEVLVGLAVVLFDVR